MPHLSPDQLVLQIERNYILCKQRIPESPLSLLIHLLHIQAVTSWGALDWLCYSRIYAITHKQQNKKLRNIVL